MRIYLLFLLLIVTAAGASAQMQREMFFSSPRIDSSRAQNLLFEIDNADFFKNNEYTSELSKGYTLPGFWIIPKLIYFPSEKTKIEVGWFLLQYFGANHYPSSSPAYIPDSLAIDHPGKFRNKAYLRIQWSPTPNLHLVVGSIYGGANHDLIEPLYQWERYLATPPEDGIQFIYKTHPLKFDVWINWQNFIFKNDPTLEQFTLGLSSEFTFTRPLRTWQLSMPLQFLARHCGGQIDDTDFGTVSEGNAAIGLKLSRPFNSKYIDSFTASVYGIVSSEIGTRGKLPYSNGSGILGNLRFDRNPFFVELGYWSSHQFISISGEPLLQSLSYMDNKTVYPNREVVLTKVGFTKEACRGLSVGAYFEGYYGKNEQIFNYTYGVHMRFNQQFFIKKLRIVN